MSPTQNRLQEILESIVEGVVAVDRDQRVVHMNAIAGTILGVVPSLGIGKPIGDVSRVPEVSQALADTMEKGEELDREFRKHDRTIELHASPLRDSGGAVLVLHDVTELRHLEAVRRDFVANVSHEIKTPLTAIRGLVETILDDEAMKGDTQRNFLEKVHRQAGRLSAIVTDLLTISRIESEDEALEREPVDLREPIEESFRVQSPGGESKKLDIDLELPKKPVVVMGDAEALRQVVDNLLTNAIKYTPEGGRVWVRLKADNGSALVEVQDTGIGIDAKHRERIFERFYRVDKARSRELGGTGLGLSIVKHIALAHLGHVALESEPGKGTTFRVKLPLNI